MKLTKEDFTIRIGDDGEKYYFFDNHNPLEMIEQILKNQEDAEKWREHDKEYCRDKGIYQRLKKQIKDSEYWDQDGSPEYQIVDILQKILEGEK